LKLLVHDVNLSSITSYFDHIHLLHYKNIYLVVIKSLLNNINFRFLLNLISMMLEYIKIHYLLIVTIDDK